MATWVEPVESETDPDAPLKSELAKRWDNNVIAAFEGDTFAPKLLHRAHPSYSASSDYTLEWITMPSEVVQFGKFSSGGAATGSVKSTLWQFTAMRGGSLRITCDLRGAGGAATMRVYVDGVLTHTSTPTSSGTFVNATFDVGFSDSSHVRIDLVLNYSFSSGGGTATGDVHNMRLLAGGLGVYRR